MAFLLMVFFPTFSWFFSWIQILWKKTKIKLDFKIFTNNLSEQSGYYWIFVIMPRLWIQEKEIVRRQKHVSSELIRNFSGLNCYMYARYVATMLVERVSQKYARLKCHKLATEHAERLCGFQIRTYKFKITSFCFKNVRILDHYLIQFSSQ